MPLEPREVGVFNTHTSQHSRLKTIIVVTICIIVLVASYITAKALLPYTITYVSNGGTVMGEEVEPDTYSFLDLTVEPENVKKMGFYLEGWYKDKNLKNKFEFGKPIWRSRTLYAKWLPGYALVLNYASEEEEKRSGISLDELRFYYQEYVQPNTGSSLPRVFNFKDQVLQDGVYVENVHKGEQLLWFETPECIGEPLEYKDFPSMTVDRNVYGKWYDTQKEKFRVDQNGVLQEYLGYCNRIILPNNIKEIKTILPDQFMGGNLTDQQGNQQSNNFSAFKNVSSILEVIYINPAMTKLGDCSFKDCSKLEKVIFKGNNVESIGENAFQFCEKLISIDLPSEITAIPKKCFEGCVKLEKVVVGEKVTDIKELAFSSCMELDIITLPSVTYIAKRAFSGCDELDTIYLGSNEMIATNATTAANETIFDKSSEIVYGRFTIYVANQELADLYLNTAPWDDISSWQLPLYASHIIFQVKTN